jgi:hypothetical protein
MLEIKISNEKRTITHIDGLTDSKVIVQKLVEHFSSACTPLSQECSSKLRNVYTNLRPSYTGKPLSGENSYDAELIENFIAILARSKAVDLDYLSAEHFHFCHPLLPTYSIIQVVQYYDFSWSCTSQFLLQLYCASREK